jgi:hypothetical protein
MTAIVKTFIVLKIIQSVLLACEAESHEQLKIYTCTKMYLNSFFLADPDKKC